MIRTVVVDDDPDFRFLVRLWMERLDPGRYEVVAEAGTGSEATAMVDLHEPDLVLLDLTMPETDPVQTIVDLKDRHPEIRVVVLTGHDRNERIEVVVDHGADGFITKTATFELMRDRIDSILGRAS